MGGITIYNWKVKKLSDRSPDAAEREREEGVEGHLKRLDVLFLQDLMDSERGLLLAVVYLHFVATLRSIMEYPLPRLPLPF